MFLVSTRTPTRLFRDPDTFCLVTLSSFRALGTSANEERTGRILHGRFLKVKGMISFEYKLYSVLPCLKPQVSSHVP